MDGGRRMRRSGDGQHTCRFTTIGLGLGAPGAMDSACVLLWAELPYQPIPSSLLLCELFLLHGTVLYILLKWFNRSHRTHLINIIYVQIFIVANFVVKVDARHNNTPDTCRTSEELYAPYLEAKSGGRGSTLASITVGLQIVLATDATTQCRTHPGIATPQIHAGHPRRTIYTLFRCEEWWRGQYYDIYNRGYANRSRYHPMWEPSWTATISTPGRQTTSLVPPSWPIDTNRWHYIVTGYHGRDGKNVLFKDLPRRRAS